MLTRFQLEIKDFWLEPSPEGKDPEGSHGYWRIFDYADS